MMKSRRMAACLFILWLNFIVFNVCGRQASSFYLKPNDRVVFYGDSITEQSFYTNYVETYVVTRFPQFKVGFINSGWSGDRIYGGAGGTLDERLRRDVFAHHPTVLTAMFGMNDACYVEFNADCYQGFTEGYKRFFALVKKDSPNLRLTLLVPSPFDDFTDSHAWRLAPPVKGGYNRVVMRFGQFVRELADRNALTVADMNAPLVSVIQKAQTLDRDLAQKIIPDRIHPSEAGGLLMANILLTAWRAPSVVTEVELGANSKFPAKTENTRITNLRIGHTLSWTQLDSALPLPVDMTDTTIAFVVRLSDVVENLNRQTLTVKNLSAPRYVLKIDKRNIAVFTREELARGINLATLPTPMFKQAMTVYRLTAEHNRIHYARWREVQTPLAKDKLTTAPQTLRALDALESELVRKQRATAQPRPQRYALIPQL